jgi:hypothetical protein
MSIAEIEMTFVEQQRITDLADDLAQLSVAELEMAHQVWKQAARGVTNVAEARRCLVVHKALVMATKVKLTQVQLWHGIALQEAYGDLLPFNVMQSLCR